MPDTAVLAAERTLPHNLEAERSVLGAILVHNDAFNLAAQVIDSGDFYRDAHRRIFDKMVQLNERNQAIDFVTLKEELSRAGEIDEVGGPAYVASLADGVPRATNVEYYARIVKEKATLRNLIFAANKILTNAYEADQESDLILDEAESSIFAVADDRLKAGFVPMRELVKESFPKIEQLFEQKRLITGVPTGFVDLDEMTRGFQPGDLIIVAARPSMGKTSLVLNIAQHVAVQPDHTVGFFSLEMSKESLFLRLLTSEAQIDSHRLMSGAIGQKDYGRISHALETLSAMRLFIDDTANISVLEMRAKVSPSPVGTSTQPAGGRLHPADERPRPLREPDARARLDFPIAEGARQRAVRPDRRLVAVEPRSRVALGSSSAALGSARVRGAGAGRGRRRPDLSRGRVQPRSE
jgi:replicative DNA helicase